MKEIRTCALQIDDVLASAIYCNFSYKLLLPKGTVINRKHLEKLKALKCYGSCMVLASADTDGICINLLNKITDSKVKKAYIDAFVAGKAIYENLSHGNPLNIRLACEVVDVLVDQILRSETLLLQLTAIRLIDDYTFSHMLNCALYAAAMGRCLDKTPEEIRDISWQASCTMWAKQKFPKKYYINVGNCPRKSS